MKWRERIAESRRAALVVVVVNCLIASAVLLRAFLSEASWVVRVLALVGVTGVLTLTGLVAWTRLIRQDPRL
jgi:hypothetical protein